MVYKRDGTDVSAPMPPLTMALMEQNQWLTPKIAERRSARVIASG